MSKKEKIFFLAIILYGLIMCGYRYEDLHTDLHEVKTAVEYANGELDEIEREIAAEEPAEPLKTYAGEYTITFYCPCEKCCGKSDGITASGSVATEGRTIAAEGFPMGTVLYIEALNEYFVVEDRFGNPSLTDRLDIFVNSHQEALENGVLHSEVYVCE